jgi:predicted ester cyclase
VSAEEPKEVVRAFYERVINGRDVGAIDELLTAGFRHNGEERGRDGQRLAVEAFLGGFSDLRNEIEIILAEGDLVAAHQTWSGTHDGEFMGSPPSGRVVTFKSTAILRVDGDRIAEAWDVVDVGLAAQLDASA